MNRLREVELMEEVQFLQKRVRRLQADKLELAMPQDEGPTHAQINRMMNKKFKPTIVRGL